MVVVGRVWVRWVLRADNGVSLALFSDIQQTRRYTRTLPIMCMGWRVLIDKHHAKKRNGRQKKREEVPETWQHLSCFGFRGFVLLSHEHEHTIRVHTHTNTVSE